MHRGVEHSAMAETSLFLVKIIFCGGLWYFAGMMTVISYPLSTRRVGMNHWYGFRFPQAYYSEEAWYDINAYGGKMFIRWGAFAAVAGILFFILPIDDTTLLLAAYLSLLATLFIPIGFAYAYASHFRRPPEG